MSQIRSGQMISGREHFSRSATNGGATGGSSAPVFTDRDHIRSPQYQAYNKRLSTFTKWPSSMTQRPEEVAQAGFYYTGLNDVVRCFACDGGLKNWDPGDDPWIKHDRWFPQCPFVQFVKGRDFIELVKRMTDESDEEEGVVVHSTFQRNNVLANQSDSQHLSVGNDIDEPSQLDTYTAQAVIEMGYSKSAVATAIDVLISKDKKVYTAQDILYVLLEKEDRGELLPTDSDSELPRNRSQSFRSTPYVKEDEPSQLDTYAAQAVIEMGYSESVVATAIDVLISKDKKGYTAEDILYVLLEKEDRELLPTDSDSELPRNRSQSFRSTFESTLIRQYRNVIRNETSRMMSSIDMIGFEAEHLFGLERSRIFFDLLDEELCHFGSAGAISEFVPNMAESTVSQNVISFFEHAYDTMSRLMTLLSCPDSKILQQMPVQNFISLMKSVIKSSLKAQTKRREKLSLEGNIYTMVDPKDFERALGEEIPEDVLNRLRNKDEMVVHRFVDTRLERHQPSDRKENRPIHYTYFPSDVRPFMYIPTANGSYWHHLDMRRADRVHRHNK